LGDGRIGKKVQTTNAGIGLKILLVNPNLPDCVECKKYKHYQYKNCDGGNPPSVFITDKSIRFQVDKDIHLQFCPKIILLNENVIELLQMYSLYEKGVMYENGGYLDQPYWYIEAMQYLDSIKNEYERKELEQAKRGI